jgi:hypothetical protein
LHPLYVAIREYLEIDPRIKVLNERCRVFLDLADILADSVADAKMSNITWIIIALIVVSIVVTMSEVLLRFGMLSKGKSAHGGLGNVIGGGDRDGNGESGGDGGGKAGLDLRWLRESNISLEELRLWSRALSEREKAAVCGQEFVGRTFAGV